MNILDVSAASQLAREIIIFFRALHLRSIMRGARLYSTFSPCSYSIFKCFCPTLFSSLSHRKIFFNGDVIITFSFLQVWSVSCFLEYVVFSSLYTVVNPRSRVLPSSLRGSSCRCIETGIVFFERRKFFVQKKRTMDKRNESFREMKKLSFFKSELKNTKFKTFLLINNFSVRIERN